MYIEAKDIPYLKSCPNDGRMRLLMTYFDGKEWYSLIQHPGEKIINFKFVEYVSGIYLAEAPASDADTEIPLLTFLFQYLPTRETFTAFSLLNSDLENSLAVLSKQFILFHHFCANEKDSSYTRIISTELEYSLLNHRSAFDLLNRLAIVFLGRHGFKKNDIPDSFRKVAQKPHEARIKYGLSGPLSDFYTSKIDRFMLFRSVRDAIVHHGHSMDLIFKMPEGFGLSGTSLVGKKLKEGGIWEVMKPVPNDIGSCFALFCFLADDLYVALADFTKAFIASFKGLPAETAPGYKIYARSPLSRYRNLLAEYMANPWCMGKKFD